MGNITPIYHITHIDNLLGILQDGCLWCDALTKAHRHDPVNIAYVGLKHRRQLTPVTVGAFGMLADYVPFYFCNRSPMLCAIHNRKVNEYSGSQEKIIYLVSSVEHVLAEGERSWCFTDGHGVEAITQFYDSYAQLDQIDWNLITHWSWKNTANDSDKKRRKQAEFLVYQSFPVSLIEKIGVFSVAQRQEVDSILQQCSYSLPVVVERKWYY